MCTLHRYICLFSKDYIYIYIYIIIFIFLFLYKQMRELKITLIFRQNNFLFDTHRLPIGDFKP